MAKQDQIAAAFEQLVQQGSTVVKQHGWDGRLFQRDPPSDEYALFRARALNLIHRACGENSQHFAELRQIAEGQQSKFNSFFYVQCLGVLRAAQADFNAGLLFDVRRLLEAEILGDFIDQAEALLASGYFHPAASLAGAILEDTLRKLCPKYSIAVPSETKISRLNEDLARAGAYDKLVSKQIITFADLRNNADHGKFDKVSKPDIEHMVKWVRQFAAEQLK
jgi:hypothetical protein